MIDGVITGWVWVACYCTLDFMLGQMGRKQGDHAEHYIQVSYVSRRPRQRWPQGLDSGSIHSRSSSVMAPSSQPLSLLAVLSFGNRRKLRMSLGQGCSPKPKSSPPQPPVPRDSQRHSL